MCKFSSSSAPGYRALSTDIRHWVIEAPVVIKVRWQMEDEEREMRMRSEVKERLSPLFSCVSGRRRCGSLDRVADMPQLGRSESLIKYSPSLMNGSSDPKTAGLASIMSSYRGSSSALTSGSKRSLGQLYAVD